MPVVLVAVEAAAPGPVSCSNLTVLAPVDATHYACPIKTKTRTIIVNAGQQATIDWEIRNKQGQAVDISDCVDAIAPDEPGEVKVRFQDVLNDPEDTYSLTATVVSSAAGQVRFQIPATVAGTPGIWAFEVAVYNTSGVLVFTDRGWLSVEPGMFGISGLSDTGPVTIGDIRMALRDTLVENDLNDEVEFDDAEIIYALIQPIREWNESPPTIQSYTPATFPWKFHYTKGVCAHLLRIAAGWYLRNKLQVQHGGNVDDSRNRDQAYLQLSQLYYQEWKEWMQQKSMEINIASAYGMMS